MDNNQSNSHKAPDKEISGGDTAAQKTEPLSHFKRALVPLDEYAARQGISSDIVEQQGQLGVIQIRKFKGQKFVVDVPTDQLSEFEADQVAENADVLIKSRPTIASKLVTAGLIAVNIIIVVTVFWLYIDAKTHLDDLNADYTMLQDRYNDLTTSNQNVKAMQDQLAGSKVEFARIQNRIALSRTELERIQADLNKARRNLETVQSELTGVQGQISLSKVEIESIQNGLSESRKELDTLYRQNTQPGTQ
jgi:archaellum component FlaC